MLRKAECVGILCAYAPHNLRPLDERMQFYGLLDSTFKRCSVNGYKYVVRDFNAKLDSEWRCDESVLGPWGYGGEAAAQVEVPKKELLIEFCYGNGLVVTNTFMETPTEERVTFFVPGASPLCDVVEGKYHLLDLFLCDGAALSKLGDLRSSRTACLATNNYLLACAILSATKEPSKSRVLTRSDRTALRSEGTTKYFTEAFCDHVQTCGENYLSLESRWATTVAAVLAAEGQLPARKKAPNRPWISEETMKLIDLRMAARSLNNGEEEKRLHKLVRRSARKDKDNWLNAVITDGGWKNVNLIRKPRKVKKGKLRDQSGNLCESNQWAETMAQHLETVQWKVRPAGPHLPVSMQPFTEAEIRAVVRKLKKRKAAGSDDIPAEYWQTITQVEAGIMWLTDLCNHCLREGAVPSE